MTSNDPNELEQDFSDEELLDDDLQGFDDDELYEDDLDDSGSNAPVKQKKKLPIFNIAIIGGALLVGLFILSSMGKKTPDNGTGMAPSPEQTANLPSAPSITPDVPANPDPNNIANIQDNDVIPAPPAGQQATAPQTQGFMNDPSQLQQNGQAPSLPDQPNMTGFANAPVAPGAPDTLSANQDLPVPQNLPSINQIKKAAPVTETSLSQSQPVATPVTSSAPSTDKEAELQAKLDQVMTRMDSIEKKIATQPAPSPSSTNSGELASLRIAIERLEQKVSKISNQPVVQTSQSSSWNDNQAEKVVVKKAVPKKKKATPPKESEKAWSPSRASSSISSSWVLRSASPGMAMVSKSGQAGLQMVRVGDSIPGLGYVQSISQMGGRWVVQGSSGSVSQ